MNTVKKIAIAAAFLCAATAANAEGMKVGGKVQYFATQPTGDGAKEADMSFLGFGAGVALKIPLSGDLSVNPGLDFYYAKPLSQTVDLGPFGKYETNVTELGLSVPAVVQYDISGAYVGGGVQIDIPLSSKSTVEVSGISGVPDSKVEGDVKDRSAIDLGIAIVAGYNVAENISVGAKGVIGLTETAKDSKTKFNKYGVGVTYFF